MTFTLLALFFFKAINRVRHVRYHRAAYSFFGISAVVVFVLVCVEAAYRGITADAGDSVATQRWNDSEQITVGIVFFFMSLFYLTIAVRVWGMNPSDYSRALLEQVRAISCLPPVCLVVWLLWMFD